MVEVVGRSVETILKDWRAVERQLVDASDVERPLFEARSAALREEHRAAITAREIEAAELSGTPHVSAPSDGTSVRG